MLPTVVKMIEDTNYPEFDVYYRNYMNQVQDNNILSEVKSVRAVDVLSIDNLIARLLQSNL